MKCSECMQKFCSFRGSTEDGECGYVDKHFSENLSKLITNQIIKQMNFTTEQLRESAQKLYSDIDKCITELIKARVSRDEYAEGKALFTMEHLMVGTQQELACVNDFLYELLQEKEK